jgi:hypothetical protein
MPEPIIPTPPTVPTVVDRGKDKDKPSRGGGVRRDPERDTDNPFGGVRFVVEFATVNNNGTLCPITKKLHRGRWTMNNIKSRVPDDRFARMPDLPGIQILFDGRGRKVQILDPLVTDKYAEVLALAQDVMQQFGWPDEPEETDTRTEQTNDQLKEWVYWARRWLDAEQVEVVQGNVPEMSEVEALPGRVEHNNFDLSLNKESFPDAKKRPPYKAPPKIKQKVKRRKKLRHLVTDDRDEWQDNRPR